MAKGERQVALYRKYRSQSFDEVIGQEHVTSVLQRALSENRISHAYLFTGPHGVGKTSVARILAHRLNQEEYEPENNHIDIIEIDAASNRRIDEIRDLRDKVHIAPVNAKYKVYIVDEVHMLTKEAFNALLKVLEEPPEHVVFILATTEAHKLPTTIISRTQRHTFQPVTEQVLAGHLKKLAKAESVQITNEALVLLASHAEGSVRDAVSLLDQATSLDGKIDADALRRMLGETPSAQIDQLLQAVTKGDSKAIREVLTSSKETGVQPEVLAKQLIAALQADERYLDNLDLVDDLIHVPMSPAPQIQLEIALLKRVPGSPKLAPHSSSAAQPFTPEKRSTPTGASSSKPDSQNSAPKTTALDRELTDVEWQDITAYIKTHNNALASILRTARFASTPEAIQLELRFAFHKNKLESAEAQQLLESAMMQVVSGVLPLELSIGESPPSTPAKPNEDDVVDKVISTFGGGEKVNI